MSVTRFLAVLACSTVALTVPVVTPAWSAPRPGEPTIRQIPLPVDDLSTLASGSEVVGQSAAAPGDVVLAQSEELPTGEFSMIGATWAEGGTVPTIEVRTANDGTWSSWSTLERVDGGPQPGSAEAASAVTAATAPLWVGDADTAQVRVQAPRAELGAVEVVVIDPGETPAGAGEAQPLATANAAAARPAIISRAQWGADESLKCSSVKYMSTIKAATVHHTAGGNAYSTKAQAMAQLRADYAYHTKTLGWCDLGYNFVIDKFGNIYEGRAGGVDRAVQGAHAGGFNADTVGVSALGNYSSVAPPAAMLNAISSIVAWKLGAYGRDPQGQVTLTSAGGGTSRFPAGQQVRLPVIFGHRQVGSTACPGDSLYNKMSTIRTQVSHLMSAPSLAPVPEGGLARTQADPTVYAISGSNRYPLDGLATLKALAPLGQVAIVDGTGLQSRTVGSKLGRLVLGPDGAVWHLDAGQRRYVGTCDLVAMYGGDCRTLPRFTADQIGKFTKGPQLTQFAKSSTSAAVFAMLDGKRRAVLAWNDLVLAAGTGSPQVTSLAPDTVDSMAKGAQMLAPSALVKTATDPTVWLINGYREKIAADSLGVTAAVTSRPIATVDASAVAAYSRSSQVLNSAIRCGSTAYLAGAGRLRPVDGAVAGGYGIAWTTPDSLTCSALTATSGGGVYTGKLFVKDGTSPTVYQVAKGVRRPVQSWATLQRLAGTTPLVVEFSNAAVRTLPLGAPLT